jgi:predicted nucleotidyltransferase
MKFDEYPGVKVLRWFLEHPSSSIHFRDLCRRVNLSPLTVKTYAEEFVQNGWLGEQRNANLRFFSLSNDNFVVKSMKRTLILDKLSRLGITPIVKGKIISLALYGSHASGDNDEQSDLDLLLIGSKDQIDHASLNKMKKSMKKEIQLTVMPLSKWEKNKKSDPFILSVIKNHVLIAGASL